MVWWACDVQFPSWFQCLLCISKTNNPATDTYIIIIILYISVIATITNIICLYTITNIYRGNNYTSPTQSTCHYHHNHQWWADLHIPFVNYLQRLCHFHCRLKVICTRLPLLSLDLSRSLSQLRRYHNHSLAIFLPTTHVFLCVTPYCKTAQPCAFKAGY